MVKPERRARGDVLAAAAILVVMIVVGVLIWWTSDARATLNRPAATPAPALTPARAVPASLQQLWTARSAKTREPVVVAGTVVTGDGREMVGRDPATGAERWSFARDRELCGISWVYDQAVAVYPDTRGCGQVSTVDARTGQRGPTRSGYADDRIELSSDGTTVLAAGRTRIEMWRSDMVRTLAYGDVDAPINPPVPPKPPCEFLSTAASSSAASIVENCPHEPDVRLTLLRVSKEDVAPDQRFVPQPDLKADSGAKVLAVSDLLTAVYLPTPQPRVVVVDDTGQQTSSTLLPKPAAPNGAVSRAGDVVTYWTGDSVVVLDATTLTYRYKVGPGGLVGAPPARGGLSDRGETPATVAPIGPAEIMADRLLIPVTGGIAVYEPSNGALERVIPVDRGQVRGPVTLGIAGPMVVEQRDDMVVALGEPA